MSLEWTPEKHEPLPYCDCHACALEERNRLRGRVQELQQALAFWHPGVPAEDSEFAERAAHDAWLLTCYEGPVEPPARERGWITATPPAATTPPVDRHTKVPRLMYWEDAIDAYTLTPDLVENIIDVDQFTHDGDEMEIRFKRMDLSEAEIDEMPEA